jgi:hypothetical protein
MNCRQCKRVIDSFNDEKLPSGLKTQIINHLEECESCAGFYRIQDLIDIVIGREKNIMSDPFLATRISAHIQSLNEQERSSVFLVRRILKPTLVTISMAAAIFIGIMLGNLSGSAERTMVIPEEFALINDASLEYIDLLSIE